MLQFKSVNELKEIDLKDLAKFVQELEKYYRVVKQVQYLREGIEIKQRELSIIHDESNIHPIERD